MPSTNDYNNNMSLERFKMLVIQQGINLAQRGMWEEYFKMMHMLCDNNVEL